MLAAARALSLEEAVEWRVPIWASAVGDALSRATPLLPPGSSVVEIGYGSGLMACYLALRHGWHIVGYEPNLDHQAEARRNAARYGLEGQVEFRVVPEAEMTGVRGQYDGLFVKSVLFHLSDRATYLRWLDWMAGLVRPGGHAVVIENGAGGRLDYLHRRFIRRVFWATHPLHSEWVEEEYRRRFSRVDVTYFGRYSQFLSFNGPLYRLAERVERALAPPTVRRCFVAAIVAQR